MFVQCLRGGKAETISVKVKVNGKDYSEEVEPRLLLVHFLRDKLRLTGAHVGCVTGKCGCCTILVDGESVKSCMMLAAQCDNSTIMTVEGLSDEDGKPHPLQKAFQESDALECGYCTPGMLMNSYALLEKIPEPSEEQIRKYMVGNLCRCTGYVNIVRAIQEASRRKITKDNDR